MTSQLEIVDNFFTPRSNQTSPHDLYLIQSINVDIDVVVVVVVVVTVVRSKNFLMLLLMLLLLVLKELRNFCNRRGCCCLSGNLWHLC